MSLSEQLVDYIRAAFTGIWVQTHEPDEAERELVRLSKDEQWRLVAWDVASGLRIPSSEAQPESACGDPLAALRTMMTAANPDETSLLVLHNFHRFLNQPEVIQTAFKLLVEGKQKRTFLVILAPVVQIPIELEKLFVVVEHALPNRDQLGEIARELVSERPEEMPKGDELNKILNAAAGLTRYEAEGAFALSIARHDSIQPATIWDLKTQALKKGGLLSLYRGSEGFNQLGGLESMKQFCMRALRHSNSRIVKPKGVMLLGVPGVGKSYFARALGNQAGRPTLVLDMGALYGSLVGQTEANIRHALRIIDLMAPCICFIDEVEKALAGVGGNGDSGVSSRLFGTFLTWLSDHESDVFVVCTSNDISKLPPEFSR